MRIRDPVLIITIILVIQAFLLLYIAVMHT